MALLIGRAAPAGQRPDRRIGPGAATMGGCRHGARSLAVRITVSQPIAKPADTLFWLSPRDYRAHARMGCDLSEAFLLDGHGEAAVGGSSFCRNRSGAVLGFSLHLVFASHACGRGGRCTRGRGSCVSLGGTWRLSPLADGRTEVAFHLPFQVGMRMAAPGCLEPLIAALYRPTCARAAAFKECGLGPGLVQLALAGCSSTTSAPAPPSAGRACTKASTSFFCTSQRCTRPLSTGVFPGEPIPLPCTTRTQRMPVRWARRMNWPRASRASSTRRPCRSSWRWMLQWPPRSLCVTSRPMPGRRKLNWSSMSSRVLTSNSSLMASRSTRCSSSSSCRGSGSGGSGAWRWRAGAALSACTGPTVFSNSFCSASARRAASARCCCSRASCAAASASAWRSGARSWRLVAFNVMVTPVVPQFRHPGGHAASQAAGSFRTCSARSPVRLRGGSYMPEYTPARHAAMYLRVEQVVTLQCQSQLGRSRRSGAIRAGHRRRTARRAWMALADLPGLAAVGDAAAPVHDTTIDRRRHGQTCPVRRQAAKVVQQLRAHLAAGSGRRRWPLAVDGAVDLQGPGPRVLAPWTARRGGVGGAGDELAGIGLGQLSWRIR
ncbi:hypothetical protein FQR65_LT20286 [Abscondita terminalis]|nr:hypothetical protein FQR65_LT20286 [Abscondita terminalis]